ncbi:gliding motility-associated ABC transporter ATP-binding subunit GldA [Chitinophagaceae bacterium IBVUCB1]|nr:gliding motility-associated ABC transporter ATP-binding subunit GldA [Chitinophagaceae bacterium IBVUCB1]
MSIIVNTVSKIYDKQYAVDNISFELKKGEIVGFLGPNGAGKSTTMKMICGYLPATNGSIIVCGSDVQDKPMDVKRNIGYLPEANPLYYDMYVREYLEMSAGIHGIKNVKNRIEEMITLTGLTKEAHKKIGMLSKGYKQRVGLAQAMLHNPDVLILDEPTTGLDPNQIIEIRELITRIGKEKTVLLSTHIMQEVQAMCSRVIIINSGKIVADDAIEKIQQSNKKQDVLIVTFDKQPAADLFNSLKHKKRYELLQNGIKIYTDNPDALRKEVMQLALDNNININTMNTETLSLEDVFRSLTANN